ncbi:hypothetical protein [Streptomyces sp. NPDC047976]|uniref:hypothetical protein n=1 Tax=unclassified Streptomyces TaxID=2593676 RepID=UPI0034460D26
MHDTDGVFRQFYDALRLPSWTQRPEGIERGRLVLVMPCDAAAVPSLRGRLRACMEEES